MQVKGISKIGGTIENILLIQLGDIGDVVLSLPCMKALRENFPHARLIVALRDKAAELLTDVPWVDGVISISRKKQTLLDEVRYQASFIARLRRFRFDLSINLWLGDRAALLAFLAGARQRISFYAHDGKLWQNRVSTHLNLLDYPLGQYVADYYSSLLAAYNIRPRDPIPRLDVSDDRLKQAEALFAAEGIPGSQAVIALQPFSLWRYKELALPKYADLAGQITLNYGLPVVIVGSPDERERASAIVASSGPNVFNLAGRTSIGMLAAVLKKCALFIGVDSAGMHIAAAVGTPTVSIFGPSSAASWAPRGLHHAVVHADLSCVPCRRKGCEGKEQSRCLDDLSVARVMSAIEAQLLEILR